MAEFNLARIRYTWKNIWLQGATYIKDDIIRHGGNTYVCMVGHTSSQTSFDLDLSADPPKWLKMADGYQWKGNWVVDTLYKENDLFKYDGIVYRVTQEHRSNEDAAIGITEDEDKLIGFAATTNWRRDWTPLTRYRKNDVILYGGYAYNCIQEHTSSSVVSGLEVDADK